jgi:hypothetical protein
MTFARLEFCRTTGVCRVVTVTIVFAMLCYAYVRPSIRPSVYPSDSPFALLVNCSEMVTDNTISSFTKL